MYKKNKIILTVSNDLNQDQRMHRICSTLHNAGHKVVLVGRTKKKSAQLLKMPFYQKRIFCFFQKGFLFYAEYNLRLFVYLLFSTYDKVCAVDLDTLIPAVLVSGIKRIDVYFDAHEYFSETPEVTDRVFVKKIWEWIGKYLIPKTKIRYTVNESLAKLFSKKYGVHFSTIYNVPVSVKTDPIFKDLTKPKILLYQGVLNKGRCIENMIRAMEMLPEYELHLVGEGDLSDSLRLLAKKSLVADRIQFLGWMNPHELQTKTQDAVLGINLLEKKSLNYYYSLANKFFDYMHAGVPSVNMDFPEYATIIQKYNTGLLLHNSTPHHISESIKILLNDPEAYKKMQIACFEAKKHFNWEKESQKLLKLY